MAIFDLPQSPGEKVAAEIGPNAIFCPCDVTKADQVEGAIEKTIQSFGAIHINVNCAGIGWAQRTVTRQGPHPIEPFVKVLEVNLIGTFNVIRLAADRMTRNEPNADVASTTAGGAVLSSCGLPLSCSTSRWSSIFGVTRAAIARAASETRIATS